MEAKDPDEGRLARVCNALLITDLSVLASPAAVGDPDATFRMYRCACTVLDLGNNQAPSVYHVYSGLSESDALRLLPPVFSVYAERHRSGEGCHITATYRSAGSERIEHFGAVNRDIVYNLLVFVHCGMTPGAIEASIAEFTSRVAGRTLFVVVRPDDSPAGYQAVECRDPFGY